MSQNQTQIESGLDSEAQVELLRTMWLSRYGDLREQSLIRQGGGWFHISGMGHEAMAALAPTLREDDYLFPYYRDRSLMLGMGIDTHELALSFYAKRESSSGGRQLPGHFSKRARNIWSHPSPVGAHLLPACGAAWGMQLDGGDNIVYASLGEAAARQGDFFESVCFAKERTLPVLFVVQDNRIAISTSTTRTNPLALGVLNRDEWLEVDGSDVDTVQRAGSEAIARIRGGGGPVCLWCHVERFSNHSSADDQRMYRASTELDDMHARDPIPAYAQRLIADGILSAEEAEAIETEIKESVRADYQKAAAAGDPKAEEGLLHLDSGCNASAGKPPIELGATCRILDAVNKTFHAAMDAQPEVVFFGEDIADPKGGVFNLTKGLSTKDPIRAVNSPLAESTIMGVAVGLAAYGKRPCFEIQFVDFIYPGWNQLVSNMSTLRWRSFGDWKCPLVIYAPSGGYLPGGALWHSQSAEGSFARLPGIKVAMPATPEDAAGLFWSALHGDDPALILLPKHLMWAEQTVHGVEPVPFGEARIVREGDLLTIVSWGNCLELVEESLAELPELEGVELIDLRSIAPWDRATLTASVRKTGRLLVVQEDNVSCSVGQMVIAELCGHPELLAALKGPPLLVSKGDVHIGFNPIYEYAVLPDKERVKAAIERLLASGLKISLDQTLTPNAVDALSESSAMDPAQPDEDSVDDLKIVTVPILGEGIRTARIVAFHKSVGDAVKADDPLCEVETDKAVFPIEIDEDGSLFEWKVGEDEEVSVGQEIAVISRSGRIPLATIKQPAAPAKEAQDYETIKLSAGLSQEAIRALEGIVPATIEVTCRWEAVRDARLRSKAMDGPTVSTAAMSAWAVAQAMGRHQRFASIIRGPDLIHDPERFDLGIAVAREGDALETAVMANAGNQDWPTFFDAFNEAVRRVRHGAVDSKKRVSLSISSMGPYNVRSAIPIVVPPSIATLFIGAPYLSPNPKSKTGDSMEVCSLVLTFDHRWINGVGAASFLADVRKGIERFDCF